VATAPRAQSDFAADFCGVVVDARAPAVAQLSFETSLKITCTLCGVPPQMLTKSSVTALANFSFCSRLRPSNISTRMIGKCFSHTPFDLAGFRNGADLRLDAMTVASTVSLKFYTVGTQDVNCSINRSATWDPRCAPRVHAAV